MPKRTDTPEQPEQPEQAGPDAAATPATPRAAARASRRPSVPRAGAGRPLPPGSGPGARITFAVRPERPETPSPRAEERRPRAPFVLLGLVVVLLTAVIGAFGVISTGFFRVARVEVQGAVLVPKEDIALAAGVVGRDLFDINPADVQVRVTRVSGVRAATVTKQWPRHVTIRVEERKPVAVWQVGGVGYLVDQDGVVLDYSPDPNLLTIVETGGARGLTAGDRTDGDAVVLAARLRDLMPLSVGQRPGRFEWSQETGLQVMTEQGLRVRVGDGQNLEYKLSVWRAILERANKEKTSVAEIDLRFGDRVYFR